ncbi:MAG: hypothetical protein JW732_06715 [Dehalococcoidia bacterium]|nr:hypothetical protein [Dehalococcoidia bacterium]
MNNEVKPTWRLAWGLWWRMFLISLGISAVVGLIIFLVMLIAGVSLLQPFFAEPWAF